MLTDLLGGQLNPPKGVGLPAPNELTTLVASIDSLVPIPDEYTNIIAGYVIADAKAESEVSYFSNSGPQDLIAHLNAMKQADKFPVLIGVDSESAYLPADPVDSSTANFSSDHVLAIKDFNPKTNQVYIENSWGEDSDGWISVNDLYKATF
jgi:hypothetical protein